MKIDRTFIINLKRDIERREKVEKQLKKENIINYEFITGIDGQNGDLENYSFNILQDWNEPFTRKTITKGECGCALTHYNIWKKIVQENIEHCLILEDDIIIANNFNSKLQEKLDNISNFDLLYVGRRPLSKNEIIVNTHIIKAKYSYGMHAYILSITGARKLLEYNFLNNIFPVDEFLPLIYDSDYPLIQYKKYFQNKPEFYAYSIEPLLIDTISGNDYKSSTFCSDPYILQNNNILILTVGKEGDVLNRFKKSCEMYGYSYKVLGESNSMDLLKKELCDNLNKIVIFSNCNAVITTNEKELLEKYNNLVKNTDNTIIFSANVNCYPINLSEYYPNSHTKMKYLNSDGYIGKASNILQLLDIIIRCNDNQLFYTMQYLNQTHIKIILDHTCEIFQPLNECIDDIKIQYNKSRIVNNLLGSSPCILNGNGSEQINLYFNSICNYLGDGWNNTYKYCNTNKIKSIPKIYICYDRNNIQDIIDYPSEMYITKNINLENVVEDFLKTDAEYLFVIDKTCHITNKNTLKELLNINKSIVGPMFKKQDNSIWSNFWGSLDNNGYYKRSFDYLNIISYERKAIWNVPYLYGIYLIKRKFLEEYPNIYKDNSSMDIDMRFCKNVRCTNTFIYVTNMNKYGFISDIDVKSYDEITIYDYDNKYWESKYVHPEYIKNIDNLLSICSEPCKDIFYFPIFTELFCNEVTKICNTHTWSDGKNDKIDMRINAYENVPTQDIHLNQINFEKQWEKIIFKYIAPIASNVYSFYKTKKSNISFIVKYSMDGQKELIKHHDASTYTINICLNNSFEGGGCSFVRQNFILNNKQIGSAVIHPGRLTHYHEGLQITNGIRYILVSFIN